MFPWMMMINLLKVNWKPLFAVTIAFLFTLGVYNSGKRSVRAEWQQSLVEAQEKARTIEVDKGIINNLIGVRNEKTRSNIDFIYGNVIDGLLASDGDMSEKPCASSKPDENARADEVYRASRRAIKKAIIDIQKKAEENTASWNDLQDYVNRVCLGIK